MAGDGPRDNPAIDALAEAPYDHPSSMPTRELVRGAA